MLEHQLLNSCTANVGQVCTGMHAYAHMLLPVAADHGGVMPSCTAWST